MEREQASALTPTERVELIRELATLPGVTGICLDPTFRSCPTPTAIAELGVVSSPTPLGVGEIRDNVSPREGAALMGAIGRARRCGAAELELHTGLEQVGTHIAIIDVTEQYGVYVGLSGDGLHVPGSPVSTPSVRPRRIVHHRNEIAELIWVDPLTEAMLGLDPSEMLGRSALHYVHPDDHGRGIDAWLSMLAGEPPVRHRIRWATGDGGWRWVEVTHTDRLASDGHVESEMVDVDEEMRALARARERELQFNTLTESLPLGVIHVAAGGEILYMNGWLSDYADFDPTAEVGQRFWTIQAEDREQLNIAFRAASHHGEATDLDVRVTRRRHNDERVCRVRVRPVADDSEDGPRTAIASVEDITDSVKLETRLRRKAMTDDLTGLDNRPSLVNRLHDRLADADRENGVAALFIDLDGFKMINDGLGHDAGDNLLVEVAGRLSRVLRHDDLLARIGGDEFVVIIADCPNLDHAAALADRIIEANEAPFAIDGTDAKVSCSVGIAMERGFEPISAEQLLTNADLAMYKAKRAGGCRWAAFDDSLRNRMTRTFELQRGILESIENNEFSLFLQPLRDLGSGRTVGAECLVRWFHPVHGLTGTDQFIEIAEHSGLIVPLGRWILDSACRIAARARAIGREDLRISVNVSGRQLAHSGFIDEFHDAVGRHGISPSQMILEVTETVFVGTDGDAIEMLRAIKRSGATIALDDFGTGYSSLNQLRLMPASMIKIDGSYVGDLEVDSGTRAITQALVDLSGELGLELIAEGVETPEQLRMLQVMGVELGQGYLLGRPAQEEEFFTALRQRQMAQLPALPADSSGDGLAH
ncbi:MAG: EAL domain-containing protein [Acidimicrobiales bacterium]